MTRDQDVLHRLGRSRTRDDIIQVVADYIKELEFSHFCYGAGLPQPGRRPEAVIYQTYPAGWIEHYSREKFIEIDPTVNDGQRNNQLQVWSDDLFHKAPQLWQDAQDHGMRVGVAQSAWAMGGSFGLLSLSRDGQALSASELEAKKHKIGWIAATLHSAMVEKGRIVPESKPNLTPREYEILCWLTEGKTAESIGENLSITTRTVNYHIGNILTKLKATNKVQAIVAAISSGILSV